MLSAAAVEVAIVVLPNPAADAGAWAPVPGGTVFAASLAAHAHRLLFAATVAVSVWQFVSGYAHFPVFARAGDGATGDGDLSHVATAVGHASMSILRKLPASPMSSKP